MVYQTGPSIFTKRTLLVPLQDAILELSDSHVDPLGVVQGRQNAERFSRAINQDMSKHSGLNGQLYYMCCLIND